MRLLSSLAILAGLLLVPTGRLVAQDNPETSQPPAAAAAAEDDASGERPADAADAEEDSLPALREQSIYIPYNKLREVFEKQGRGVFLPYEKFQALWKQARANQAEPPEAQPPVGALIAEIRNEATVENDVVTVSATLTIELLSPGWHHVPLRLRQAAIRSARVAGEPAHVTFDPQTGYQLLVHHKSPEPGRVELELDYAKAYAKTPGQNRVTFDAPQASINRWQIRIPQQGVKVNVVPLIAATEVPPEPPAEGEAAVAETVVQAFVGAAPTVRVDWTPKAEGASGLDALATVQAEQEVTIDEGAIRTRTRLAYDISRAELTQLQVRVPAEHKVTGVFDPNVRKWDVAADEADEFQTITVELFQPARGRQQVTIELERFVTEVAMLDLPVPTVEALNVARQQGIVVARVMSELQGEAASRTGLAQLDAAELPPSLRNQQWLAAYRYSMLPFELVLHVEKVEPRVRAVQYVEVFLEPQKMTVDLLARLTIEQAGLFQLEFDLPPGFSVRRVQGDDRGGATPVVVDSHQLEGDDNRRLKLNLSQKAIGNVGVLVTLERPLEDANLQTPADEPAAIELPIPRVATDVEQLQGGVVVYAPESLRVNPTDLAGVRTVSFAEARQQGQFARGERLAGLREVLALAHADEAVELTLAVERRRPHVTARQLLTVHVESGVVKYSAHFFYDIRYSGVADLRIDVPADLADRITNETGGIRDAPLAPQPDDVAEGYTAWNFAGEGEFLGNTQFVLTWQQNVDELQVGSSTEVEIPALRPAGVNRAWGQIVIAKAETLDVLPARDAVNLRPIDPQHDLMPGAPRIDAARAFEFHDDWQLAVTATRYELQAVKPTSVERAMVRAVVTRSDKIAVQALYRLRSAVQRLAIEVPAGAEFDIDPLRINGAVRSLETGDQNQKFIPLSEFGPDTSVLVELRYTIDGDYRNLGFPVFPDQPPVQSEPAMQMVVMSVYLPEPMALLGVDGPWTYEQAHWYHRLNYPVRTDDDDYLDWVSAGLTLENTGFRNFPTDGRLYTFTTLRPPPPPEGSLRLWAVNENGLNATLLGGLLVVTIMFLRRSAAAKFLALGCIVIVVVLTGVFAPTFAMQLLDPWLAVGLALVILVWVLVTLYAARVWFRQLAARTVAPRPASAAPTGAANSIGAIEVEDGEEGQASAADGATGDQAEAGDGAGTSPFQESAGGDHADGDSGGGHSANGGSADGGSADSESKDGPNESSQGGDHHA